jgi:hypothetical protein
MRSPNSPIIIHIVQSWQFLNKAKPNINITTTAHLAILKLPSLIKDTSASPQTEPNSLPALDVSSSTNVSSMAENDRQKSCNNADCYIPDIDNQSTALLRIPTHGQKFRTCARNISQRFVF